MKWLPCLALPLLLSGCLQGSNAFPSLMPRAYEVDPADVAQRSAGAPPAPVAPAPSPLSYEQRQALESALAAHRSADAAFRTALPAVRSAVAAAAGTAPGAEAWVVAQQALSRLEIARSPSVSALADLDRLLTERLAQEEQGAAVGGAEALTDARTRVAAAVAEQSAIMDALSVRIG